MSITPRIAITPGEPAGIGPELAVQLIQKDWPAQIGWVVDPQLLQARAEQLHLPIQITSYQPHTPVTPSKAGTALVLPVPLAAPSIPAKLDTQNADYVLQTLRIATQGCLDNTFSALVTGPVHKGIINDAGTPFSGHTEFLAELTHAWPVMMLATGDLRVALVTTHLPLADVAKQITPSRLTRVIQILHKDLSQQFALDNPRILVCGLNPHAGENGHLGREEINIIIPVLKQLKEAGINLVGPLPADTLFTPANLDNADAVLAMYHDQGLPVLKHIGFGNAINITLGLPIIRTSVDHGVALDLAGSGNADSGSFNAALELACQMAHKHELQKTPY